MCLLEVPKCSAVEGGRELPLSTSFPLDLSIGNKRAGREDMRKASVIQKRDFRVVGFGFLESLELLFIFK